MKLFQKFLFISTVALLAVLSLSLYVSEINRIAIAPSSNRAPHQSLTTKDRKTAPISSTNQLPKIKSYFSPTRPQQINLKTWLTNNGKCLTHLTRHSDRETLLRCLRTISKNLPISLTQQDKPALDHLGGFPSSFHANLPRRDLPRFGSCAVVSSASSLLRYEFGPLIDSHDAVIRLNGAPTIGYEKHVGSKTSLRVINARVARNLSLLEPEIRLEFREGKSIFFVRDTPPSLTRGEKETGYDRLNSGKFVPLDTYRDLREKFGESDLYLMHPLFAFVVGLELLRYGEGKKDIFISSSSGFHAVLMALFLCDSVSSFEVATADDLSRKKPYYFKIPNENDMNHSYYRGASWHPLNLERRILERLSDSTIGNATSSFHLQLGSV